MKDEVKEIKNPVNQMNTGLMILNGIILVEPEGFEPSSKQAIAKLSSCLVLVQLSTHDRPKTAYRTLSFFSLGFPSKP